MSFYDLLDGHATFDDACRGRGPLDTIHYDNDGQWHVAMEEAVIVGMPRQIRFFFCQILACNAVIDPNALWNTFKYRMSDDFLTNEELHAPHAVHDDDGVWSWYALAHIWQIPMNGWTNITMSIIYLE